jgi:hypothetical protein
MAVTTNFAPALASPTITASPSASVTTLQDLVSAQTTPEYFGASPKAPTAATTPVNAAAVDDNHDEHLFSDSDLVDVSPTGSPPAETSSPLSEAPPSGPLPSSSSEPLTSDIAGLAVKAAHRAKQRALVLAEIVSSEKSLRIPPFSFFRICCLLLLVF